MTARARHVRAASSSSVVAARSSPRCHAKRSPLPLANRSRRPPPLCARASADASAPRRCRAADRTTHARRSAAPRVASRMRLSTSALPHAVAGYLVGSTCAPTLATAGRALLASLSWSRTSRALAVAPCCAHRSRVERASRLAASFAGARVVAATRPAGPMDAIRGRAHRARSSSRRSARGATRPSRTWSAVAGRPRVARCAGDLSRVASTRAAAHATLGPATLR